MCHDSVCGGGQRCSVKSHCTIPTQNDNYFVRLSEFIIPLYDSVYDVQETDMGEGGLERIIIFIFYHFIFFEFSEESASKKKPRAYRKNKNT